MKRDMQWLNSRWASGLISAMLAFASLEPSAAADADKGLALAAQWCNACHSIGVDEPRQEDAGPQFSELAKNDADYLRAAIGRPHDFMPDFPNLTDADKEDLIAYIRSLNRT